LTVIRWICASSIFSTPAASWMPVRRSSIRPFGFS
jgi:hypothetical protein